MDRHRLPRRGVRRLPPGASRSGCIDSCGFRKDGYYFYQSQWTEKPVLHLFPHWNWKGREGQFVPVACYTNCDAVELFLNGKSVGVKGYDVSPLRHAGPLRTILPAAGRRGPHAPSDLHLSWDVPYEPGTLRAVGMKGGKVAAEVEISTTGDPAAISLTADRDAIRADRRDVAPHHRGDARCAGPDASRRRQRSLTFEVQRRRQADRRGQRQHVRHGRRFQGPEHQSLPRSVPGHRRIIGQFRPAPCNCLIPRP